MRPAHLPRSEDDLAHWRVYADELLSRGDRLGELIALDLSLPLQPHTAELEHFQRIARRRCRASRFLEIGWCLGHARTVRVAEKQDAKLTNRRGPRFPEREQLAELKNFFKRDSAQLIESIEARLSPDTLWPFLQAIRKAPATCVELRLELHGDFEAPEYAELQTEMPKSVRRIALLRGDPARLAGIDELDLRFFGSGITAGVPAGPKVITSLPGDAALLGDAGLLAVIPRAPLLAVQRRNEVVGATAQLRRTVSEAYSVVPQARWIAVVPAVGSRLPTLMRHGSGSWTVRAFRSEEGFEALAVGVNGAGVTPGENAPLVNGDTVAFDERSFVFLEDASTRKAFSAPEASLKTQRE